MPFNLSDPSKRIKRRCCHNGICPECSGFFCVLNNTVRLRIDTSDEHRDTPCNCFHTCRDNLPPAFIRTEYNLTGRSQEEQAVNARIDHTVNRTYKACPVQFPVSSERGHNGRDNAPECSCHNIFPYTSCYYAHSAAVGWSSEGAAPSSSFV